MAKILRNIDQIIDTQGNELSVANPVEIPPQLESFRNKIINGIFSIDQRKILPITHTGSSSIPTTSRAIDRWMTRKSTGNDNPQSILYDQDVLDLGLVNVMKFESFGDSAWFGQKIEDVNLKSLSNKKVTLSFYAKTDDSTKFITAFFHSDVGQRNRPEHGQRYFLPNSTEGFVNGEDTDTDPSGKLIYLSTEWKRYVLTMQMGDLSYDFGSHIVLGFGQGNVNELYLTGIQLEEGEVATPFEQRPYGLELSLCQRYCEAIDINQMASVYSSWLGKHYLTCEFKTTKRVAPSATSVAITNYQPGGGTGTAVMEGNSLSSARIYTGSTNSTFNLQYINNGHTNEDAIMIFDAEL